MPGRQALESRFNTGKPPSRPLQSFFWMTYLKDIYPTYILKYWQRFVLKSSGQLNTW